MTEQKEFDFLEETINEIRKGASLESIKTKLIIRKYDIKQQLTLTDVGCSLPSKEEVSSKLRQLDKRWELSKNESDKQAFNHGFKSCVKWIKKQSE